ncbi:MAG: hypothetical protein OEO20_10925 [Gemmatimonadota bacterium]|jgi:hypothetical protein|nr:hypothetical protein [Gemmatimonadota bacterium]MDH3367871.1 hypothetical protein [Gemmatimonadota bacterium]MDH3478805.1 hypothetical protein [Gemmatimonadota bacterium]MDH3568870.1 hypothetical protein [Gemmatimonadota bacterium]MDH5548330.1 hypothetical protein [Gemmatimonadota bacterium]
MVLVPRLMQVAIAVAVVNVPFGYWRAGARRFSQSWFIAVHTPVPIVVVMRLVAGIAWRLANLPLLMGAFVSGQLLGGALRRWRERRRNARVSVGRRGL